MPKNLTKIKIPSEAPKVPTLLPDNQESMLSLEHMLPNISLQKYTEHVTKGQPEVRAKVTSTGCESEYQNRLSKIRASVHELNTPTLVLNQNSQPFLIDRSFVTPQPEISLINRLNLNRVQDQQNLTFQSEPPQQSSQLKEIIEEPTQMNETGGMNSTQRSNPADAPDSTVQSKGKFRSIKVMPRKEFRRKESLVGALNITDTSFGQQGMQKMSNLIKEDFKRFKEGGLTLDQGQSPSPRDLN